MSATPAVFTASDSYQRDTLLWSPDRALDADPEDIAYVASRADEGDSTSVYVFTFWRVGRRDGWQAGMREALDADDRERAMLRFRYGISRRTPNPRKARRGKRR